MAVERGSRLPFSDPSDLHPPLSNLIPLSGLAFALDVCALILMLILPRVLMIKRLSHMIGRVKGEDSKLQRESPA